MNINKTQMKNKYNLSKKAHGFTLVEFLVALMIIVLMITAAAGIEVRYMRYASEVKRKLQTQGLVESRMNVIRQIRDTNLITNLDAFAQITEANCPPKPDVGCWLYKDASGSWKLKKADTAGNEDIQTINNTQYTIKVYVED